MTPNSKDVEKIARKVFIEEIVSVRETAGKKFQNL